MFHTQMSMVFPNKTLFMHTQKDYQKPGQVGSMSRTWPYMTYGIFPEHITKQHVKVITYTHHQEAVYD